MKLFVIWDIDNCIADDLWRQPLIDTSKRGDDRYREYNSKLGSDRLVHEAEFRLFMQMGATPVFFTGRSEYLRGATNKWLWENLQLAHPIMYMRPDNMEMAPRDLKEAMLAKFFREHMGFGHRIIGAFDDLGSVVSMYRNHNLPAAVLAIHPDVHGVYDKKDHE